MRASSGIDENPEGIRGCHPAREFWRRISAARLHEVDSAASSGCSPWLPAWLSEYALELFSTELDNPGDRAAKHPAAFGRDSIPRCDRATRVRGHDPCGGGFVSSLDGGGLFNL